MLIRLILATGDEALQKRLQRQLDASDVSVQSVESGGPVWQNVVRSCADVMVIRESFIPQPTESGLAMLNNLPENPTTIVLHDDESAEDQAQLVAAGADVVLYSGLSARRLIRAIEATLESRRQLLQKERYERMGGSKPGISDFVSESAAMQLFMMEEVIPVIRSDSTLLILGETGVGKEHLVKAIHAESNRAAGPLVAVNVAALPEQLLESELFGHEQGAFTGAVRSRRGAFELGHKGTIFLDEIGEMPLHLQAKLLRVLQEYEVQPVGAEQPVWVDVRIIAASNRDLEDAAERGLFRRDLYYRLSVVTLTVPPLRQRREDIPTLVARFVESLSQRIGREIEGVDEVALLALMSYDWPGNVRELMNVIERAILICKSTRLTLNDLPHVFHQVHDDQGARALEPGSIPESWLQMTLPEVREQVLAQTDRAYLSMVLRETQGRVGQAARRAGIHSRGLYNKMRELGLRKEDFKPS